jgi:hypothetical protein
MKKSAVKSTFVVFAIVGIFLIVIALIIHYSMPGPSMPSFSFLNGRKPAYHCIKSQLGNKIIQDIYSFEADFDEVFPEANKELLALGFADKTSSEPGVWDHNYWLRKGLYEQINVRIHKRQKLGVYSNPESSDYSSPDQYVFHVRDGWTSVTVSIQVVLRQIRFYSWLYSIINRLRS